MGRKYHDADRLDYIITNKRDNNKCRNKKKILFWIIFIILVLALACYIYVDRFAKAKTTDNGKDKKIEEVKPEPEPEVQIFKGDSRPVAVMIDNEPGAWPQAGLQEAYMIYEIIVEGGQTRMMALFKGTDTAKVGPVRSSRHYFVKYAMEHSAIYAHFGWSPQAENLIKSNSVNNINGISYDGNKFWREGYGYHTAFTSIPNLRETATSLGYLTIGSEEPLYKYSARPYEIKDGLDVEGINMVYSTSHSVSYSYDSKRQVFLRSQRGSAHTDRETKQQYYTKNIIVMTARNYSLNDGSGKGRQELVNEGTGSGYYLTNGKCIEITWKKDSITSKTYFNYLNGEEIILNDGLTFIQVVPQGQSINISYKQVVNKVQTTDTNVN